MFDVFISGFSDTITALWALLVLQTYFLLVSNFRLQFTYTRPSRILNLYVLN